LYEQVAQNKRRSALIIAGFVVVVVAVVAAFDLILGGGWIGVVIAVPLATIAAFTSYWKSDAIALAMSRARPADEVQYARLHNLVEGLCVASGLP
jgi:heat shock protein HtpX